MVGDLDHFQQGVDPIVCASACVLSLQTVISRNVSYADPAVLSVCFLHGGETSNVIPDTCRFGGTIRDLSPSVFDTIQKRFIAIGIPMRPVPQSLFHCLLWLVAQLNYHLCWLNQWKKHVKHMGVSVL